MVENGLESQSPAALVKMFERAVRYGLRGCTRRHRKATLERKFVHGVDLGLAQRGYDRFRLVVANSAMKSIVDEIKVVGGAAQCHVLFVEVAGDGHDDGDRRGGHVNFFYGWGVTC